MMVGVVVVNPGALLSQQISPLTESVRYESSRTLSGLSDESAGSLYDSLSVWLLNMFLLLILMVQMVVYGEPVMAKHSKQYNDFVMERKAAVGLQNSGQYSEAYTRYCLYTKIL